MYCPEKPLFIFGVIKGVILNNSMKVSAFESISCYQGRGLDAESKDSLAQTVCMTGWWALTDGSSTDRSDSTSLQCSWGQMTLKIQLKNRKLFEK